MARAERAGVLDVLVVGQTPPPVGGQSIMIEKLLEGRYERVRLHHVRMRFSTEMAEVGKFMWGKVFALLKLIVRILRARYARGARVLYFPPSPPDRISMYRDVAILLSVRWAFEATVLHFHAGGISELEDRLSPPMRFLFRRALHGADAAIRLCDLNPPDGARLRARRDFIVPYGIEDHYPGFSGTPETGRRPDRILFVGVLRETKGVGILVEACGILKKRGVGFELDLVGEFQDSSFEKELKETISRLDLAGEVRFRGRLTGDDKWKAYAEAGIFCFPSFFEGETFGIVMLEAMQFALPVVASRWRAAPSIVREGETGFIVPARDSESLAGKLASLLEQPDTASRLGEAGRRAFVKEYRLDNFYRRMEQVFLAAAGEDGSPGAAPPGTPAGRSP